MGFSLYNGKLKGVEYIYLIYKSYLFFLFIFRILFTLIYLFLYFGVCNNRLEILVSIGFLIQAQYSLYANFKPMFYFETFSLQNRLNCVKILHFTMQNKFFFFKKNQKIIVIFYQKINTNLNLSIENFYFSLK